MRRALRYIPDAGNERCLPFRGLVRTSALRAAGPLRRSMLGEFDADGRWLFRLALLGPFLRVPERLCAKRLHEASLAASWTYSSTNWALNSLSYVNEARLARLSPFELLALSVAAVCQALAHLLPRRFRARVSARRSRWGM